MDPRRLRLIALSLAAALLVAACDLEALTTPSPGATSSPSPSPTPSLATVPFPLTVGLGYIPSVQFAPFYLAQERGHYRDLGLEVTFDHQTDQDLVPLVGQGRNDIGVADGTSVITARSQGIPIRYAATIYARFPSVMIALSTSGISAPADLRGKRIGIPGPYGSSYIMLQALLASADLTLDDVTLVPFNDFSQATALAQGRVDAATGFVNNEPLQLQKVVPAGTEVVVLRVDQITPLPGPGLIVGDATVAADSEAVRRFVAATLQAMDEIAADPDAGLDAAISVVPDLASDRDHALAVLEATVETWKSPYTLANGLGAIDRAAWSASIDFMSTLTGLVPNPVTVDDLVTLEFLPAD